MSDSLSYIHVAKILGSHGDGDKDSKLLRCDTMCTGKQ